MHSLINRNIRIFSHQRYWTITAVSLHIFKCQVWNSQFLITISAFIEEVDFLLMESGSTKFVLAFCWSLQIINAYYEKIQLCSKCLWCQENHLLFPSQIMTVRTTISPLTYKRNCVSVPNSFWVVHVWFVHKFLMLCFSLKQLLRVSASCIIQCIYRISTMYALVILHTL